MSPIEVRYVNDNETQSIIVSNQEATLWIDCLDETVIRYRESEGAGYSSDYQRGPHLSSLPGSQWRTFKDLAFHVNNEKLGSDADQDALREIVDWFV